MKWTCHIVIMALLTAAGCAPKTTTEDLPVKMVSYRGQYVSNWDVPYGDHERQVMDLHLRGEWADSDDRMNLRLKGPQPPTVVFAHGSAWYVSDKREWDHFISPFLQSGYNVINLNYRLREGIAPALEDVREALFHLAENNDLYRLDLDRVFLVGTSAGGFMAMFHGAAANSDEPARQLPETMRVAGVINIVGGGTDCFALYEKLIGHDVEFWRNVGHSLVSNSERAREEMEMVCPMQYIDPGDPPVLLAHGERDEFGTPAVYLELEDALRSQGTPVERLSYPDSGHTFIQEDWEDLFPRLHTFITRYGTP